MQVADAALEHGLVLPALELVGDAAAGSILPARERLEGAVMLEHRRDLLHGVRKVDRRFSGLHGYSRDPSVSERSAFFVLGSSLLGPDRV